MIFDAINVFHLCMCVCVCARVFVCPDEELSGYSRLHRCRYGGISDIELAFSSSKRPIKNDTLMILWTFTCSSSELCHLVWKIQIQSGVIQHPFFAGNFRFIIKQILSSNPAVYVIHRLFFASFLGNSPCICRCIYICSRVWKVFSLVNHVPGTGSIFHAVKMVKSPQRPKT